MKKIEKINKFKLGDLVISKSLGCLGIVIQDPKHPKELVIQIHPFIFGKINENDWEITNE